ncbi:hypothetical protein BJ742DRAFT_769754 [Cladochytrium replicatum]|nr:hypothetical protein BJ742DRAFT_769754 [Cladochytrium replicatum]
MDEYIGDGTPLPGYYGVIGPPGFPQGGAAFGDLMYGQPVQGFPRQSSPGIPGFVPLTANSFPAPPNGGQSSPFMRHSTPPAMGGASTNQHSAPPKKERRAQLTTLAQKLIETLDDLTVGLTESVLAASDVLRSIHDRNDILSATHFVVTSLKDGLGFVEFILSAGITADEELLQQQHYPGSFGRMGSGSRPSAADGAQRTANYLKNAQALHEILNQHLAMLVREAAEYTESLPTRRNSGGTANNFFGPSSLMSTSPVPSLMNESVSSMISGTDAGASSSNLKNSIAQRFEHIENDFKTLMGNVNAIYTPQTVALLSYRICQRDAEAMRARLNRDTIPSTFLLRLFEILNGNLVTVMESLKRVRLSVTDSREYEIKTAVGGFLNKSIEMLGSGDVFFAQVEKSLRTVSTHQIPGNPPLLAATAMTMRNLKSIYPYALNAIAEEAIKVVFAAQSFVQTQSRESRRSLRTITQSFESVVQNLNQVVEDVVHSARLDQEDEFYFLQQEAGFEPSEDELMTFDSSAPNTPFIFSGGGGTGGFGTGLANPMGNQGAPLRPTLMRINPITGVQQPIGGIGATAYSNAGKFNPLAAAQQPGKMNPLAAVQQLEKFNPLVAVSSGEKVNPLLVASQKVNLGEPNQAGKFNPLMAAQQEVGRLGPEKVNPLATVSQNFGRKEKDSPFSKVNPLASINTKTNSLSSVNQDYGSPGSGSIGLGGGSSISSTNRYLGNDMVDNIARPGGYSDLFTAGYANDSVTNDLTGYGSDVSTPTAAHHPDARRKELLVDNDLPPAFKKYFSVPEMIGIDPTFVQAWKLRMGTLSFLELPPEDLNGDAEVPNSRPSRHIRQSSELTDEASEVGSYTQSLSRLSLDSGNNDGGFASMHASKRRDYLHMLVRRTVTYLNECLGASITHPYELAQAERHGIKLGTSGFEGSLRHSLNQLNIVVEKLAEEVEGLVMGQDNEHVINSPTERKMIERETKRLGQAMKNLLVAEEEVARIPYVQFTVNVLLAFKRLSNELSDVLSAAIAIGSTADKLLFESILIEQEEQAMAAVAAAAAASGSANGTQRRSQDATDTENDGFGLGRQGFKDRFDYHSDERRPSMGSLYSATSNSGKAGNAVANSFGIGTVAADPVLRRKKSTDDGALSAVGDAVQKSMRKLKRLTSYTIISSSDSDVSPARRDKAPAFIDVNPYSHSNGFMNLPGSPPVYSTPSREQAGWTSTSNLSRSDTTTTTATGTATLLGSSMPQLYHESIAPIVQRLENDRQGIEFEFEFDAMYAAAVNTAMSSLGISGSAGSLLGQPSKANAIASSGLPFAVDTPTVRAGSLAKLVERLTWWRMPDTSFIATFLRTLEDFTTPDELLDLLIDRYNYTVPDDWFESDNPEQRTRVMDTIIVPIRLRVFNVIKTWLTRYTDTILTTVVPIRRPRANSIAHDRNIDTPTPAGERPPSAPASPQSVATSPMSPSFLSLDGIEEGSLTSPKVRTKQRDSATVFLERLKAWVETVMYKDMRGPAEQLLSTIEKLQNNPSWRRRGDLQSAMYMKNTTQPPLPLLRKRLPYPVDLTLVDPLEIARQICLMDQRIYHAIRTKELLNQNWTRNSTKDKYAPNVMEMIRAFNSFVDVVTMQIMSRKTPKNRALLLKHYISVAKRLLELNNFNSCQAILTAMTSASIHRLRKSWELVPRKNQQDLRSLLQLFSAGDNYARLRQRMRIAEAPGIPWLGLYLRDLIVVEEAQRVVAKNRARKKWVSQPNAAVSTTSLSTKEEQPATSDATASPSRLANSGANLVTSADRRYSMIVLRSQFSDIEQQSGEGADSGQEASSAGFEAIQKSLSGGAALSRSLSGRYATPPNSPPRNENQGPPSILESETTAEAGPALINFSRLRMMARILEDLFRLREKPYILQEVPIIWKALTKEKGLVRTPSMQFKMSLELEPTASSSGLNVSGSSQLLNYGINFLGIGGSNTNQTSTMSPTGDDGWYGFFSSDDENADGSTSLGRRGSKRSTRTEKPRGQSAANAAVDMSSGGVSKAGGASSNEESTPTSSATVMPRSDVTPKLPTIESTQELLPLPNLGEEFNPDLFSKP